MDDVSQTKTTIGERLDLPRDPAEQVISSEPPQLNSFQFKQMNENAIQRLMATGFFPHKQAVIAAALTALFQQMTRDLAGMGTLPTAPPSSPEQEAAAEPSDASIGARLLGQRGT